MASDIKTEKFVKELKNKLAQKSHGNTTEETILIRAFKYFDLDNSGACGKDEFLKTIYKIGVTSYSQEEILQFFDYFDENHSGELDYKEFARLLYTNKRLIPKKQQIEQQPKNEEEPQKASPQKEQPDYKEIQGDNTKKEYMSKDPVQDIINLIRDKLAARGVEGICSIARNFRIVDDNNTQTIDFEEFKKACKDFQFGLDETQMKMAFVYFDRDNTGEIDYDEFIRTIRGEMNEFRQGLVQQAFNLLDINGNGQISFDEIKSKYNTRRHPEVLSGRKTEDEIIKEFMDTFQDTYNYLCGTESDNIITIEEFMEYYENVSMSIDDDAYFELLMNNAWGMGKNVTNNSDKKGWSNKDYVKENDNLRDKYQDKYGDRRPGQTEEEARREKEDAPLKKLRKEMIKKGNDSAINLYKQFKVCDENGTKELEIYDFAKAFHEYNLTNEEIRNLFDYFDKEGKGYINYEDFINTLRGPLNNIRTAIVKEAFNKLDVNKSGILDIADIKLQYNAKNDRDVKSGKRTEEEVYTEFVETFQMNHDNKVGYKNKRVALDEFLDYYNNISMNIFDDDYFVSKVQNEWKINPQYSKVTSKQSEQAPSEYSYSRGGLRGKKVKTGAAAAPFGTDLAPCEEEDKTKKFVMPETEQKVEEVSPMETLRNAVAKRGSRGIMAMRRAFMIADDDDSKSIDLPEFIKFCHDYRIPLTGKEVNGCFAEFDKDGSGRIDYNEFVRGLVGEMNDRRKNLIKIVFGTFDKNKNGVIELDDIRNTYNAKNHPDVLSGKKTEDEVLAEFLDTFQYHFSLLNNNKTRDSKITLEEFLEYYNNISMGIDDDDYFEEMIKSAYCLDERRPKKKGWKSIV